MGLSALPSWMSAAIVAAGGNDTADFAMIAAIEGTLNAHSFMPQRSTGCALKFRLYEGPLTTSFCGHPSINFTTATYNTYDIEAGGQWAWIPRGTTTGGSGGGDGSGGCGASSGSDGPKVMAEKFLFQARSSGPGTKCVPLTDPNFLPKAFIFTNLMFASSTNPDSLFSHRVDHGNLVNFALGFDDGTNSGGHAGGIAVANGPFFGDANAIQCTSSTHSILGCVQTNALIDSLRLKGRVTAKQPGSFEVTTDVQASQGDNVWIEGMALGGSDITAEVMTWLPGGVGARTATFGIVPRIVLAIASPLVEDTDARSAGWNIGWGWAVHCDGKGGCSAVGRGNGGQYACYQRAQRLCSLVNPITNLPFGEIEVTGGWGTNTLNINVLSGGVGFYKFLALGGKIAGNIGTFLQNDPTFPYKMQRPTALFVSTVGKPVATTVQRDANWSIGLQANLVTPGNPPSNYNNLINKFHLGGLLAVQKDGPSVPWGGKVETVLGNGTGITGTGLIECQEATGVGSLSLKAKAIAVLHPEFGELFWTPPPYNDNGLREFNYLLIGDDTPGDHPCGDGETDDTLVIIACPANSGMVGVPYSSAVFAAGGTTPYTFSITAGSLPPGLVLDPDTGAITGTPTVAGTFITTYQVEDADLNTAEGECTIEIAPAEDSTCVAPPGASTPGSALESF